MLMAVSNGGDLYVPVLVRSVGAAGEPPTYTAPPKAPPQLGFAKADLDGINAALCQVTRDSKLGTAVFVFKDWDMRKISICGKTGTSQNTQGEPPNAWFGAYAGPAGKPPEIAVIVFVERSREGSEVAAPIVRRIIESYYGLPYGNWPTWWAETYVPVQNPGEGGR
jgi:penicillin-binding protein 2